MGLISSSQDGIISQFYGYGTANCTQSTPIPGPTYAMGLEDLRNNYLSQSGHWGTFFIDSTQHTWSALDVNTPQRRKHRARKGFPPRAGAVVLCHRARALLILCARSVV
jgi:hypothetical protein